MTVHAFGPDGSAVVVGIDGSASSEAALKWAARLADSAGRQLRVVFILDGTDSRYVIPVEPIWPWPAATDSERGQHGNAYERLDALVAATLGPEHKFEAVIRGGDPADELLSEVKEHHASVLVLGRRGLGGFKSLLLGSVSDQCAGHAACPVVVVPAGDLPADGPLVVGIDISDSSRAAARWAADYARGTGSAVLLAACWVIKQPSYAYAVPVNELRNMVEQSLAETESMIREYAPEVAVETIIVDGSPGLALPELAHARGGVLVVVGSRGHGGFTNLLIGSSAHQTLHHATTPIAVVRP